MSCHPTLSSSLCASATPVLFQVRKTYTHLFIRSHTSNILNWVPFTLSNKILFTAYTFITRYCFLLDTFYDFKTRSKPLFFTPIISYISTVSLHNMLFYKIYISLHITDGQEVSGHACKQNKKKNLKIICL